MIKLDFAVGCSAKRIEHHELKNADDFLQFYLKNNDKGIIFNTEVHMKETDRILSTEYYSEFDDLRKNRMVMSYYKYGPVEENYGQKLVSAIENLKKRLEMYEKTGNTEYLCDIANFSMIEFKYPQHPNAHFNDLSESPGLGGMTYRDIESVSFDSKREG
jgi:hypothetical protein